MNKNHSLLKEPLINTLSAAVARYLEPALKRSLNIVNYPGSMTTVAESFMHDGRKYQVHVVVTSNPKEFLNKERAGI